MNETRWRKSTYSSSNGGNCVEVGQATRIIAVQDTKQHGRGPVLRFAPGAWRRFVDQVKRSLTSDLSHASVHSRIHGAPARYLAAPEHCR
jgi:hypothetical protein